MRTKEFLKTLTPEPIWNAAGAAKRRLLTQSKRSFSANGEDLLILGWFRHYGCDLSRIRYLDIGANHPTLLSNTFLLYEAGASGVLVEPDPQQAALLRAKRPRDVVIDAGAAFDDRRSATLFRMTSNAFNTFSRTQAEFVVASSRRWEPHARQEIVGEITVPLIPMNEIIAQHSGAADFVSIDTEGADLAILKTLDLALLSSDPKVPTFVCAEASASLCNFVETLGPAGFEFAARTPDNWIFRRHPETFTPPEG